MTSKNKKPINGSGDFHAYKLIAPYPIQDAVRRNEIIDAVFSGSDERVVFLLAPAGHGKSTALQQIKIESESRGCATAWLNLDESDNDLQRFQVHFERLVESLLEQLDFRGDSGAQSLNSFKYRLRSEWFVDTLVALNSPVAIFFDNFEAIRNSELLSFFAEVFEHAPPTIRLFVGSRSTPDVGLSRLTVSRRAIVLRSEQLRFSPGESSEFMMGDGNEEIAPADVRAIHDSAEGWPAAMQLYRLSRTNPSVRKGLGRTGAWKPDQLAEYLSENVLAMQPQWLQDFLLKTSVLTLLHPDLCRAITGRPDALRILRNIEKSGLFVRRIDEKTNCFQYHAMFSSFLAEQLKARQKGVELEVHKQAAEWHGLHENFEEVVHHEICRHEFGRAADALDAWGGQLITHAKLITMERWFDQIPLREISERRSLLIKCTWALVFLRRKEKLEPLINLLEEWRPPFDISQTTDPSVVLAMAAIARDDSASAFKIVDRAPLHMTDLSGFAAFELAAAANLAGFRQIAFADFEGARAILGLARTLGEQSLSSFSFGYTVGVMSVSQLLQGDLQGALERLRSTSDKQFGQIDDSFSDAALASCHVWALYEANELDRAEEVFAKFREVISGAALLDFLAVAQISVARIHDIRERPHRARSALEDAETIGRANHSARYVRLLAWERVRRALVDGDIDKARQIADSVVDEEDESGDWLLFSEEMEGQSLGRIRLAIHEKKFKFASGLLDDEWKKQKGRVFRQIKLNLLSALLHVRKGSRNIAQKYLRNAIELAAPGGYLRCFLDEGEDILKMLKREYRSQVDSAGRELPRQANRPFIEALLNASGSELEIGHLPTEEILPESFTEKQIQILNFLGTGISNKEMSKHLFVSENTIKFHLKNIYSKLSVQSRLQAISKARVLGLIE